MVHSKCPGYGGLSGRGCEHHHETWLRRLSAWQVLAAMVEEAVQEGVSRPDDAASSGGAIVQKAILGRRLWELISTTLAAGAAALTVNAATAARQAVGIPHILFQTVLPDTDQLLLSSISCDVSSAICWHPHHSCVSSSRINAYRSMLAGCDI